jgi:hypothetical protein
MLVHNLLYFTNTLQLHKMEEAELAVQCTTALQSNSPSTISSIQQNSPIQQSPTTSRTVRGSHGVLMIPASQIEYSPNEHLLGSGAQGLVFRAKWKSRDVVFKQLLSGHQDEREKRQFLRELEVWK